MSPSLGVALAHCGHLSLPTEDTTRRLLWCHQHRKDHWDRCREDNKGQVSSALLSLWFIEPTAGPLICVCSCRATVIVRADNPAAEVFLACLARPAFQGSIARLQLSNHRSKRHVSWVAGLGAVPSLHVAFDPFFNPASSWFSALTSGAAAEAKAAAKADAPAKVATEAKGDVEEPKSEAEAKIEDVTEAKPSAEARAVTETKPATGFQVDDLVIEHGWSLDAGQLPALGALRGLRSLRLRNWGALSLSVRPFPPKPPCHSRSRCT